MIVILIMILTDYNNLMKSNRDVIHDKQKRGWSDRDIERNQ